MYKKEKLTMKQFFKINKVLIVEERKNIFYLMCNSYQCYRFFLIEILLTLLPFVFMLFFQLIFVLVTKLSIAALIEGCVLFVVLAMSLLSQCLYLQRRNIIGDTMREKI